MKTEPFSPRVHTNRTKRITHGCRPHGRWRSGTGRFCPAGISRPAPRNTCLDGSEWSPRTSRPRPSRASECRVLLRSRQDQDQDQRNKRRRAGVTELNSQWHHTDTVQSALQRQKLKAWRIQLKRSQEVFSVEHGCSASDFCGIRHTFYSSGFFDN